MLGCHMHISSKSLNHLDSYFKYYNVCQIFLGSPRTFQVPRIDYYSVPRNKNLIIHAPFVISLVKDCSYHYTKSLKCLSELSQQCYKMGAKYIVTHIGGIDKEQSRPAMEVMYNFCMDWLEATNNQDTILCLECSPGSKKGVAKGSLTFLYNFVSRLNHPRIKICWDTEHSWANGFDLNKKQSRFLLESGHVAVVHLNSIRVDIERGSHLDRHSDNLIQDGQKIEELKFIYSLADKLLIPCVLERDPSIVQNDIDFLKKNKLKGVL